MHEKVDLVMINPTVFILFVDDHVAFSENITYKRICFLFFFLITMNV